MKQITLLVALGCFSLTCSGLFAQSCTPIDPFPPGVLFVYPQPYNDTFPQGGIADTAFVGVPYQTTLHINVPPVIVYQGITFPLNGISLATEGAIGGLPPSMDYVCNPPNCVFNANVTGCINIFGTAGAFEAGVHDLTFTGILSSIVTIPFTLPSQTTVDGNYYLFVKQCPAIETQESASVCAGGSHTFPDGTTITDIAQSFAYTSTLTAANGCDSLVYTAVDVTVVDVSVSQDGNTLTANATGSTFQWIDCAGGQPLSGETKSIFQPAVTGSYAVIVTKGLCQDTSACFNVTIDGVTEAGQELAMRISPNPASSHLRIEMGRTVPIAEVAISTLDGKMVSTREYSGLRAWDMDISTLSPGLYLVSVRTEEGIMVGRFFKSR